MPVGGRVSVTVNEAAIAELEASPEAIRLMSRIGEVVTQEQKRLCPVSPVGSSDHLSGQLRSSIGWNLEAIDGKLAVKIGTDVDYALFVILGTAPHDIRSTGPWPLRNKATGQVFGPLVHHPGTPAQDFMRPSLSVIRGAI